MIEMNMDDKNSNNVISRFFSEDPQGVCTDARFEFGNLHRKTIICNFCVDGVCHYIEECERRDIPDQELGWRTV